VRTIGRHGVGVCDIVASSFLDATCSVAIDSNKSDEYDDNVQRGGPTVGTWLVGTGRVGVGVGVVPRDHSRYSR
jgi:hypothetical protein